MIKHSTNHEIDCFTFQVLKMEGSSTRRGKNKQYWTYEEVSMLIKYLHRLSVHPKCKLDSSFKNGYMNRLEDLINNEFPNYDLKAFPHIESRIKHWSEKYSAMIEM